MTKRAAFGMAIVCAMACASITAHGAIILVDYDDGNAGNGIHDAAVRNGGFESPATGVDGEPFSNTDTWENIQGAQTEQARRTNINHTGSYSSVNSTSASKMYALDTGRTIAAGDIYTLEFYVRGAFESNNTTRVVADLYFTADDTIGGAATVIDTINSGELTTSFVVRNATFSAVGAADPEVGKSLFLRFEQSTGPGFSRTDSWYLEVVPEPMTMLTIAALGGLVIRRRRR